MTDLEKVENQLLVLNELSPRYGGKTLDNVKQNVEAKLKEMKK